MALQEKAEMMLSKVPEVTIYFWIIKVLCTTVGETAADYLNMSFGLGLSGISLLTGIFLGIVLIFQFRASKYVPGIYWIAVVLISVFGTLITDNFTDSMHLPLEVSTILFGIALAATFIIWYASEKTLSIHSIFTRRRESFYWLTILFTFALGTASGDLMAESLGLGYLVTGTIVCAVIAVISLAWSFGLNSVLSFWIVYILSRPLGASLGDYLSQSRENGGLGFGPTVTSIIFLSAIMLTVIYLSITKRDVITAKNIRETEVLSRKSVFIQVAVVLAILLSASWSGYLWSNIKLQETIKLKIASQLIDANAPGKAVAYAIRPLGDLSSFKTIAVSTLSLVDSGKLEEAKSKVNDLESTWDNKEAYLKPMNTKDWTKVDDLLDNVLRKIRAFHQDPTTCRLSLLALIEEIDKLDNSSQKD